MDKRALYSMYLLSDWWRKNRQPALDRAAGKCECCGRADALEVHHLTYVHKYHEIEYPDDLLVLCGECHRWIHTKGGTDLDIDEQRRLLATHAAELKGERIYGKEDFITECKAADYSGGGSWNLTSRNQIQDFFEIYCDCTGWNGDYAPIADTQHAIALQRYPVILNLLVENLTDDQIVAKTHFSKTMVHKVRIDPEKYKGYVKHERNH